MMDIVRSASGIPTMSRVSYRMLIVEGDSYQAKLLTGVLKSLGFMWIFWEPAVEKEELLRADTDWDIAIVNSSTVRHDFDIAGNDETSRPEEAEYLVFAKNDVSIDESLGVVYSAYKSMRLVALIPWNFQYNDIGALVQMFADRIDCVDV